MTNSNNPNPVVIEDPIELKALFFALLYQWYIIVLCVLLSLISAILYLQVTKPTYSVDAKIQMIDDKSSGLSGLSPQLASLSSLAGINLGGGQQSIQTEIEILKSRNILGKTIHDLNLDVIIHPKQSLWQKITTEQNFHTDYNQKNIIVSNQDARFIIQHLDIPKNYLDKSLSLKFKNQDFHIISDKTGLEVFKGTLNQKNTATGWNVLIESQTALQGEYQLQKQSLPMAMVALLRTLSASELAKQTGIIDINYIGTDQQHIIKVLNYILNTYQEYSLVTKATEKEKSLAFLNEQLPQLKQELEQAEQQFNTFRKQHSTIDVQEESKLYLKQNVELETQKIQLEQKRAQLSEQYTTEHPVMQGINTQINALNSKINQLNGTLKALPNLQSEYLQYFRDVQIKTQLYTNLLVSYQSLSLAKESEKDSTRILDYPVEPTKPIKPRKLVILVLSILVGGFIGILIALTRNMLQTGIRHRKEIEQATGIKTYLELPKVKKGQTSFSALDSFIPTLRFQLQQNQHNIALLSSINPDQNQALIVKNLAVSLSQSGQKVLLVDGILTGGQLHQHFDVASQMGLSEYLQGQATLDQILNATSYVNLSLIACGQHRDDISISSHQMRFAQLIEQTRGQYDYIILNATPISTNADSLNIAQHTGFNLCLVQYGKTQLKDIELAKSYFENAGLEIDGVIIDQVPAYQK